MSKNIIIVSIFISLMLLPSYAGIVEEGVRNSIYSAETSYSAITGLPPVKDNIMKSIGRPFSRDPRIVIEVGNAMYIAISGGFLDWGSVEKIIRVWAGAPFVVYSSASAAISHGKGQEGLAGAYDCMAALVDDEKAGAYSFLAAVYLLKNKDPRGINILNNLPRWNSPGDHQIKQQIIDILRKADGGNWAGRVMDFNLITKDVIK